MAVASHWCPIGILITGPLARFLHICHFGADTRQVCGYPRIDAAVADGWCWRAEAKGVADTGDGRSAALSTQGAVE